MGIRLENPVFDVTDGRGGAPDSVRALVCTRGKNALYSYKNNIKKGFLGLNLRFKAAHVTHCKSTSYVPHPPLLC